MRTATSFLLGAAMVGTTMLPTAYQAESTSVAFIDGEMILESSSIGRGASERIQVAVEGWEAQVTTATEELTALQNRLTTQGLTLNEAARANLAQQIEEKQVELSRLNDDAQRELNRLQQQLTLDVNAQLGPLVDQFATRNNYDLILDTSRLQGLLYHSEAKNVTDEFLAMVNAGAGAQD